MEMTRTDIARDCEGHMLPSKASSGDIIMFEQYAMLRKSWLWISLFAGVITVAVGVYYFTSVPVLYSSTIRVLPPNKSSTPLDNILGGLASSLKDFGISKLIGKGSTASGYLPSVIFASHPLYDSLINAYRLDEVYDLPASRRDRIYDQLQDNIDVVEEDEGPVTVTVFDTSPKRAAAMATSLVKYTNAIAKDLNRRETEPISSHIGAQLETKRNEIAEIRDRLSHFLATNRLFDPEGQSTAISQSILDAEENIRARRDAYTLYKSNLGDDDPMTKQAENRLRLAEEAADRLRKGAGSVIPGPNLDNLSTNSVEYMQLKLDYEAAIKYMAILEPIYEQSKFDEVRAIPVYNVLDPPIVATEKARPKRMVILGSTFISSILICYVVIFASSYWKAFKTRYRTYSHDHAVPAWGSIDRIKVGE